MCSSAEERINIDKQVELFTNAVGMFGHAMAKDTRDKKTLCTFFSFFLYFHVTVLYLTAYIFFIQALWWNSYGDSAPELQRVVVRILSATCSATGCERNWSIFEQVHTKRRNRLSFTKGQEQGDSYDPIYLSSMESDDEWITEKDDPTLERDNTWMDMHECFQITAAEANKKKRKRGSRNLSIMKLAQGKWSSKWKDITVVDAYEI
ncbi:hypothetical protein MKX03_016322 [Papaver bracteatum]|nr:hypothetical protein MKX03_016322 [Papaver bracteatum]